ncbi:MAG: BREX system P-loop protein BrxC [Terriglobales bacterium]
MLIKDVLLRDPSTHGLVNNGQARITNEADDGNVMSELRGELSTFVCEGQYSDGFQKILSSFLRNQNQTSQRGAWVSGFFGSGKSHLLKMLCHLWQDTSFPDGATARSIVPDLPEDVRSLLRELDTTGKRSGGLLAAAGTLPSGTTENVRLSVLSILLRAAGLPDQYPQAQFVLWLEEQGHLARIKSAVETGKKTWASELNNLYVSPIIAKALLAADKHFATSEAEARKTLREQFPVKSEDLTNTEFIGMFKRVLKRAGRNGKMPCTILILDEVQQYIGDSETRSVLITDVAEAISKELDGQVIVVGAGQAALTGVKLLNKLMDRFTIRIQLSDTDVETVTRKVLLQKQASALTDIETLLESHGGEVSRQLQGTKIGERLEDKHYIVADYPLLPVRRRFWENCFRQVDTAGTQSQLRSQLRIIYDSVARISKRQLGAIVPADDLYEALAPEMVTTGALPREINERILALGKDGTQEGRLRQRICGLVFLIGRMPLDGPGDIAVRATKEHIADLMVEDLKADNGKLRNTVATLLEKMADEAVLMRVGNEFRIQTEEGRAWDQDFRNRETRLRNDTHNFDEERTRLLLAEFNDIARKVKLTHGAAKEARSLTLYTGSEPPPSDGDSIGVWVRDQFSGSETDLVNIARAAGLGNPTLYVFIPRKVSREDLLNAIAAAQASEQTINAKGAPSTPEGQLARQSMESRKALAVQQRDNLVRDIVGATKVYQGGASELFDPTIEEKLKVGAEESLKRLFPRFKEADFAASAWEAALKRARDGADNPLSPLKHEGPIEQHPVCQQVLTAVGSGKTGTQVRRELEASPFGWPRDAVDTALIALHRSQHLTATLNGAPVVAGQLDQNKIPKTEFRVEKITLSVADRLTIRKLYQVLDLNCKAGEESVKAAEFLRAVLALANAAGGDAPLPPRPIAAALEDIQKLVGNDQLVALKSQAADLTIRIGEWSRTKQLIAQRNPVWQTVERMARHASELPDAAESRAHVEAIRAGRLLLDSSDPATPQRSKLAEILRQALNTAQQNHEAAFTSGIAELQSREAWNKIDEQQKAAILAQVGLKVPSKPDLSSDEALLAALDARNLVARKAEKDAVAGRIADALKLATQLLEPKVQFVSLEKRTLHSPDEVRQWVQRQERTLLAALANGPVQVS